MKKMVKRFFGITFSFILLVSLMYLVLAEETNWGDKVLSALESVPQGTAKYQQAYDIYLKFYDDSNKLYTENAKRPFTDPELDRCANACGDMPTGGDPGDIDIDNPDAWHQKNAMTFDQWDACRKKCNAEFEAREDKINAELHEKVRLLAEKAIADINAIKSGQTVANKPESGGFNTNSNRGRDEFGRMNPSIGGYLGDAYVVRSDGTKVIPGKELYLKVEDKIITGKNSKLNFIFKDVGGINLGENTQLRVGNALLDQYYLARGSLKTQLNWGTLPPQKLEFHTPNAVISTKGTEFVIDYNETINTTTVYLNEGTLEINVNNDINDLTAGKYLVIYPNGTGWWYPLQYEKWKALGNNFYDTSDVNKIFDYRPFMIVVSLGFVVIILLSLWIRKRQKKINQSVKAKK